MKNHIALKHLLFASLLLPLLSGLASCHGSAKRDAFAVPSEFDTSIQQNITFWSKNDSNKAQASVYEKAIADFEELYPNVKVKMVPYTDYQTIYQDVITNIPTNTTPDVCVSYPDHVATYMTGEGLVVPLDDLIDDENYGFGGKKLLYDGPSKEEVIEKFLDEGTINSVRYTLPFMRSSEALYINKEFVEKLGYTIPEVVTWDWIWEVSDKAVEKNEDGKTYKLNDQTTMIPFIYKSTDNMMITELKQRGYDYSTSRGEVLLFNEGTKSILEEIRPHAKLRSFSTFGISSYPANFLNAGQCVFAIDSTAGATWMGSNAPLSDLHDTPIIQFTTVVKEIPQSDVKNPKMISQGPSLCLFNKGDPQKVLAAWLFAQFLLTNESQVNYAETEGYIPVTTKAINSEEYQTYLSKKGQDNDDYYYVKIDASQLVIKNIDNTFVTPVFNGSANLRSAAGQLIEEVTKSERRKLEINYETLFADMVSLYRLDQIEIGEGLSSLGALSSGAIALFVVLGVTWSGIIFVFVWRKVSSRKRLHKKLA